MSVYPIESLSRLDDHDEHPHPGPPPASSDAPERVLLRGEVVVERLEVADTMLRRMRGLLGRGSLPAGGGLWITPCPSIHMFFMRFAIDAVFVDEHLQVVRVHEDLRPWRMARGGRFAHSVFELPQGTAAFYNLRVGDRLQLA